MDQDRQEKIQRVLKGLATTEEGLQLMRETLMALGHKLLPRVEFMSLPEVKDPVRIANARTGIILDTETTGFDAGKDKVIQLSMLKFLYDDQGIISLGDIFDEMGDPGFPIPPETTKVHKITDDMVAGKVICPDKLAGFLDGVSVSVAHNAEFDRKFVEADFPSAGFDGMDWHCTLSQIDWSKRGFGRSNLEMLSLGSGFVYDAHNARSDILATAFVVSRPDPETGSVPFQEMLEAATHRAHHIFAVRSPFHTKDDLKERGYKWADENNPVQGFRKVWHRVIPGDPASLIAEAEFLKEIYGGDVSLPLVTYDPKSRYSDRAGTREVDFSTKENLDVWDYMKLVSDDEPDGFVSARSMLAP